MLVSLKLFNYILASAKGVADAIILAEPERDTATRAAVADCIEVLTAFDDSMNKSPLVTFS